MTGIFISYRREDSAGYTGRLFDRLSEQFGNDQIFMDISDIEPGMDFVEAIEGALSSCDVLIVVIGKQWLNITDASSRRRLDDPDDPVRLEIVSALKRNLRVIPILIQRATMPNSKDLSDDLVNLSRRQALEISDNRWEYDVNQLIEVLDKVVSKSSQTISSLKGRTQTVVPIRSKSNVDRSKEFEELFNRGLYLYNSGKCQEAITAYDLALEIDPQNGNLWNNKGSALDKLGKCQEAINAFDKALEIDPKRTNSWFNKGLSLNNLGKYQEAIIAYDKALEIDPKNAGAWYNKGRILYNLGKYQEAITACDKVLEIDPKYEGAWYNKSIAFIDLGKYQEAVSACDKELKNNPQFANAWCNKGVALSNLGKYQEALIAYDKALEIDPKDKSALANKAMVLKLKNMDQ